MALAVVAGVVVYLRRKRKAAAVSATVPEPLPREPEPRPPGGRERPTLISEEPGPAGGEFALKALTGPRAGQTVSVGPGKLSVGRGPNNDLPLEDDYVTGVHARFENRDGRLSVLDLGSTNGTLVNGAKAGGLTVLTPGDSVRIGATEFRVLMSNRSEGR
jgi:pSer/pThr/pTyr-binding forkhead associated (FHA) protein